MDDIEKMLRALTEDDAEDCENESSEGLFSGLDAEMLLKMLTLFETLNQPDDNERFLLALRPLLREENRPKIDSALRLLKLFSILSLLNENGGFESLI